ncbi:MAG TPA: hypothetical protein VMK66_00825 [Myxococcales bacterium]|nr:hypothetical protein [Myxococcales bacterium]
MDPAGVRCHECRHFTPAFWFNLFSLLTLAVLLAATYICREYLLPVLMNILAMLGDEAWLPTRIYAALADTLATWAPWFLAAVVVLLVVLHWRKVALPKWIKSGRLLALLTWLFLLVSLAGMGAAYTETTARFGDLVAWTRLRLGYANERFAVTALGRLNAAEAAYRQKNPKLGYTCKLEELGSPAPAQPAGSYRVPGAGDLYGRGYYSGYGFVFSGCSGSPRAAYQIVARPSSSFLSRHTFCTDQAGGIRALADPSASVDDCLKKGVPVQPEE